MVVIRSLPLSYYWGLAYPIYTYHRPPPINGYFHEAISGINNWNFIMQLYSVITYDEIDIMNVNLGWWGVGEGC